MFFRKKSTPVTGTKVEFQIGNPAVFKFNQLMAQHPYLDVEANKRLIRAATAAFNISVNRVFKSIVDQVDLAREESGDSYWDENNVIQLNLDYENEENPIIVTFSSTKERTVRISVDEIFSLEESAVKVEEILNRHDQVFQEIEETIIKAGSFLKSGDEPEAPSAAIARK